MDQTNRLADAALYCWADAVRNADIEALLNTTGAELGWTGQSQGNYSNRPLALLFRSEDIQRGLPLAVHVEYEYYRSTREYRYWAGVMEHVYIADRTNQGAADKLGVSLRTVEGIRRQLKRMALVKVRMHHWGESREEMAA